MPITSSPGDLGLPDIGKNYVPDDAIPLYVGGTDPDGAPWNWNSVAKRFGVDVYALIQYNYKTTIPEVVNFYLHRNCGCTTSTPDGKNYRFLGAIPGIIYLPGVNPIVYFKRLPRRPMTLRDDPERPGGQRLDACFEVYLMLNPKLPSPELYEYRQMIRGEAWITEGTFDEPANTLRWRSNGRPSRVNPAQFDIPGLPYGLLPRDWKVDGVKDKYGTRLYGYREQANWWGADRDVYLPDRWGWEYCNRDYPGLCGQFRRGQRVKLDLHFQAKVVRFDKLPGDPARSIVQEIPLQGGKWAYEFEGIVFSAMPPVTVKLSEVELA